MQAFFFYLIFADLFGIGFKNLQKLRRLFLRRNRALRTSPSTTAAKSRVGVMVFSGAAVVYKCTENLRAHKAKQYPAHYGSSRTARYRDGIAKKKVCADCVGLIKGYQWTNGG